MNPLLFLFFILIFCWPVGTFTAPNIWSLTTDVKIESIYWPQTYGTDTNHTLNRLAIGPSLSARFSDTYRFNFKPILLWDPQNKSSEERWFFDLVETYFRFKGERINLQIGNHIFHWGVTDGFNPLDVMNPRQYFDPLHPIKLGVPSILFSNSTENSEQELIYIPKNRGSLLPGPQSRWLPRKIFIPRTVDNDTVLLLPETLNYSYESRKNLNHALDNNFGFRLQWHLGAIDFGITGFENVALFPIVQPIVTGTVIQLSPKVILQTDPDVKLRTNNYRQRGGGFFWVSSQADFLFKYATNYSQSLGDDPLLPGWTHESIVGLEKSFNIGSEGQLVAVLQHSFINTERASDSNLSVTDIFRNAWMAGGRFSWGENWTFVALGLYDSNRYGNFQQYTLARRFYDTWTAELSTELIAGPEDSPLGVYSDNDNYRFSLRRSF